MSLTTVDKRIPVLIVDDGATMRRVIKNCLKQLGFENISEAEDGAAALTKLEAEKYQLIISDWNMPNMMGIDLLRAVKSRDDLKDIPFVMVTAEIERAHMPTAIEAGASTCVVKPFTALVLEKKLQELFS